MSKRPELDKIAIWRGAEFEGLSVREYSSYEYEGKTSADANKTVYRYTKNYELDGKRYALLVLSHESQEDVIEKRFTKANKALTAEDKKYIKSGMNNFRYLEG